MRLTFFFVLFLSSIFCFSQNDTIKKDSIRGTEWDWDDASGGEHPIPVPESKFEHFFRPANSYNAKRGNGIYISEGIVTVGSLTALSQVWYKDFPRSKFHFFNDNAEWLQMDKCGHATTSYVIGNFGIDFLKWAGIKREKAIWIGGLTGFSYQFILEMFDGYSSGWGFSIGDVSANAFGSAILIGQEFLWNEQRVQLKYSFRKTTFSQYRPDQLGKNWHEQIFKDYNGQTYWVSVNIFSFTNRKSRFPQFLNLAFGYGASGMTGARFNPTMTNSAGNVILFDRYRQYYLSFDIDLAKIKTSSPFLKTVFKTFGFLKIPAPGLEFSKGKVYGRWLCY